MAEPDRYTRLINWLKILLPLVALGILSTLFLVSERLDPEAAIPYAKVDVERILREQGITKPTFGGVSADGSAISLSAAAVRPGGERRERLTGTDMSATISTPDGGRLEIASPEGIVDAGTREAIFTGGVRLESSTGYAVEAERIEASFAEARAISAGGVTATGPAGSLEAGSMALTKAADGSYLLVFKDRVRLVYRPGP